VGVPSRLERARHIFRSIHFYHEVWSRGTAILDGYVILH
jgi:hypothetical protein